MSRFRKGNAAGAVGALGCAFVGAHEGLKTVSYQDVVGVWTACYGETRGVRAGQKFTKPTCDAMFIKRLDEFGNAVERCAPSLADEKRTPVKRYIAHVSLAYNIGETAYCKSSIARLENAGQSRRACHAFRLYNRAGGKVWKGLDRRRAEEEALCLQEAA